MSTSTQPVEHVSFDQPDEVREGDNWRLELVNLAGGAQVGRSPYSRVGDGRRTSSPSRAPTYARPRISSTRSADVSTW
jgi:hypothetical protein